MPNLKPDPSLVTVRIEGLPLPWTMSVLEDGPDEGESQYARSSWINSKPRDDWSRRTTYLYTVRGAKFATTRSSAPRRWSYSPRVLGYSRPTSLASDVAAAEALGFTLRASARASHALSSTY